MLALLALGAARAQAAPAPPVISGVTARAAAPSGVIVEWSTNEAADTEVDFGPTEAYGNTSSLNSPPSMTHALILGGLAPGTVYHYRVKSRNAAGAQAVSPGFTFGTDAPPPAAPPGTGDGPPAVVEAFAAPASTSATGSAPVVLIMTPAPGANLSGIATVSANAISGRGVPVVQFLLDGADLAPPLSTAPYTFSWNTALAGDGRHALAAVARDPSGGSATSPIVLVTVDNAPPAITEVSASAVSADTAVIGWTTSEPADSQVEYGMTLEYGDSTPLSSTRVLTRGAPLSGLASEALYHYRVKSRDASGLLSVSEDFVFATGETPPPLGAAGAAGAASAAPAAAAVPAKAPQKILTPATADGINDRAVFGPDAGEVSIMDMRGRRVYHAKFEGKPLVWDGRDGSGRIVPSGVYIAVVVTKSSKRLYQTFAVAK